MLTGAAFFCDREEGLIWCDSCVPALVVHLAAPADVGTAGADRYQVVESGELLVHHILPRDASPLRMRARCHSCGAVQPPGSVAFSTQEVNRGSD